MKRNNIVAIVGTVGLPASYGGFETLVENLVVYHSESESELDLIVYCSSKRYPERKGRWRTATLRYIPLDANGIQSIGYDIFSIVMAIVRDKADVLLVLGVSGAVILPFVRIFTNTTIITNIDGVEWRREKWRGLAKMFLRFSEYVAVKASAVVIADNEGIAEYVEERYGRECELIAYGGDHVLSVNAKPYQEQVLPSSYVFSVCRIEKENNVSMILSAFVPGEAIGLVVVGNWNASEYGIKLKREYKGCKNILLLDPIYDLGVLRYLRETSIAIVHGHSAGGTNPALVEAMWLGKPLLVFDCNYNRFTTNGYAAYFANSNDLRDLICRNLKNSTSESLRSSVFKLKETATRMYSWNYIANKYLELMAN